MKQYKKLLQAGVLSILLWAMFGCSVAGRLQRRQTTASLSQLTRAERQQRQADSRPQVVNLQRDSNTFYLAPVDTLADGERVMSLQIEQVTVVSRMRSIPERKQILAKKKELLERKLREVENCIDYIDGKQQFCDDVLSGKIPYTSNLIDIPKET